MSINSRIREALASLEEPVRANTYVPADSSERYFTFNVSTLGADYADDEPVHERALIMLHYFCPSDYDSVETVRTVKGLLRGADFTWPSVTNAGDEAGQHIVFEFECAEGTAGEAGS